jgi:hypothetical protein
MMDPRDSLSDSQDFLVSSLKLSFGLLVFATLNCPVLDNRTFPSSIMFLQETCSVNVSVNKPNSV